MEEGRFRLGYIIALLPSSLRGTCHAIHCSPRFIRRKVKGSVGRGVCAFNEMVDREELLRVPPPLCPRGPRDGWAAGLRGSFLSSPQSANDHVAYLARHFSSIQNSAQLGLLSNSCWLPGPEDPADASKRRKSDVAPLLRLLAPCDPPRTHSFAEIALSPLPLCHFSAFFPQSG